MPADRASVLIVGSVNVDYVVRVDHLPVPGETVTGGLFALHHGGKGANQAVAAARLGAEVRFVGAVGDDQAGRSALADLRAEGIDVAGVRTLEGLATGVALISVDRGGEAQITVASGANAALDGAMVGAALAPAEAAAGGVFLANLEVSDECVLAGARYATERGMRVIINTAPARSLPAELLALGPLLVPNEGEALALSGEPDVLAAAKVLAARTGAPVVVTLGVSGALLLDESGVDSVAAPRVEAVDGTGAGDTFGGALAAELAGGSSLSEAVRFAVAAASLSVTKPGARTGMPRRAEVERLL